MSLNWKTTTAGAVAAIASLAEFIASVPPELQNKVPMLFPEEHRGTVALYSSFVFAAAVFVFAYFSKDKLKKLD